MGERIPSGNGNGNGSYFQFPPPGPSPIRSSDHRERFLAELLAERQKLGPFLQVLPQCTRLLTQEIRRISGFNQGFPDHERFEPDSPFRPSGQHPNSRPMDMEGWPAVPREDNGNLQRMGPFQAPLVGWHGAQGIPTTPVVKRVIRLDVPVDKYPNYNFVGRILGPRGNSLKRVEAMTECRVYIRGCGSVKDSIKEEKLKDKPGYEHLNEPLHLLVEAEFPEDIINSRLDHAVAVLENLLKPVDESLDHYPTSMYVAEAWVNRMKPRFRRVEFKGRGRTGMITSPATTISVVLKEEKTRIREHGDRVAKEAKRKPWVHLPNRPISAQRPYYSW